MQLFTIVMLTFICSVVQMLISITLCANMQTSSSTDPTHSEREVKDVSPIDNQALVINSFNTKI